MIGSFKWAFLISFNLYKSAPIPFFRISSKVLFGCLPVSIDSNKSFFSSTNSTALYIKSHLKNLNNFQIIFFYHLNLDLTQLYTGVPLECYCCL